MIKIEAVTVCVGYADFLYETAHYNTGLLDRWIIVTSPEDEATREVCRIFDLETVLSSDHARDGGFNKGRMIDRGLDHCSADCFRLQLDGDIVLPGSFRTMLAGAHLDERKIYGCDRQMVRSWEEWQRLKGSDWLHHTHCSINMPRGEIGTRWGRADTGYVPIGFFQLWHAAADEWRGRRIRRYPTAHGTACRTDVQHALQWDRRDRELLPEIVVVHLESEAAPLGANWAGRTTKPFGPGANLVVSGQRACS
jgi:hypothetical protein